MLFRIVLAVALLAAPLASSGATFDLDRWVESGAKIVNAVDLADTDFDAGKKKKWWKKKRIRRKNPKPMPAVPEPSAALLFGLGAVAVGLGIRRRK